MPSDHELQEAYGHLLGIRAPEDRGGCVSPEAILALVERSEDEKGRLNTLDHVMGCPGCRQEFELLQALSGSQPRRKAPSGLVAALSPRRLAWAASLVLMVGAGSVWLTLQRSPSEAVMRGGDTELRLISPAAGAGIQDGVTFVWHPLPGGFEYTVEVFDANGDVVLASSTRDTTFTVPDVLPGGDADGLQWWVTARTENGLRTNSEIRVLRPPSR